MTTRLPRLSVPYPSDAPEVTKRTLNDIIGYLRRSETALQRLEQRLTAAETGITTLQTDITRAAAAWAYIECDGSGGVAVTKGKGVASAAASSGNLLVTLSNAMADSDYVVVASARGATSGLIPSLLTAITTSTTLYIDLDNNAGADLNPGTQACEIWLAVYGDLA